MDSGPKRAYVPPSDSEDSEQEPSKKSRKSSAGLFGWTGAPSGKEARQASGKSQVPSPGIFGGWTDAPSGKEARQASGKSQVQPSSGIFGGWTSTPPGKAIPQTNASDTDCSDSNSDDDDNEDEEEKAKEFRKNIYKEGTHLVNEKKQSEAWRQWLVKWTNDSKQAADRLVAEAIDAVNQNTATNGINELERLAGKSCAVLCIMKKRRPKATGITVYLILKISDCIADSTIISRVMITGIALDEVLLKEDIAHYFGQFSGLEEVATDERGYPGYLNLGSIGGTLGQEGNNVK